MMAMLIAASFLVATTVMSLVACWSVRRYEAVSDENRMFLLETIRKFSRALQLAERYGEGNAYHVTEEGRLLVASAKEYLYAAFTGCQEFWDLVANDRRAADMSARAIEELNGGDPERSLSCILNACGKTYLDIVGFPSGLSYPYVCFGATAKQLHEELLEKVENDSDYCFHAGKSSTTA